MNAQSTPKRPLWSLCVVTLCAATEFGWLAFDGLHGLTTGDYVTPNEGPYAGQLGPWSKLIEAIGIEPRSSLFMSVHVALGMAGLVALGLFLRGTRAGRKMLLACAVLGLWYLPFGTLLGLIVIAILVTAARRERMNPSEPRSESS